MKLIRYFYQNKIKAGLLVNKSQIIDIDDITLNTETSLTDHDKYVIENKLYNVEPIFLIPLINKV
jgi:Glutathionylspermidine synthase